MGSEMCIRDSPQSIPLNFTRIRRPNPFFRRPQLVPRSQSCLVDPIDVLMKIQHEMGPVAHQYTPGVRNPTRVETIEFGEKGRDVDHDAVANDTRGVGIENTGGE